MTNQHVQHMHKALTQMNVQIQHVISDHGGDWASDCGCDSRRERDTPVLAKLRDWRIKASEEIIEKSLGGNWRAEHLFTLQQSGKSYQHYQEQIVACDEEIEQLIVAFGPRVDPAERPLPPDRKRKERGRKKKIANPQTGQAGFDLRTESYKLFGVDLTQMGFISGSVNVGTDLTRRVTLDIDKPVTLLGSHAAFGLNLMGT